MNIEVNEIPRFFDSLADRWDELVNHDPRKLDYILKQANLRPGMRILDVGCGTGVLEEYLLPHSPEQIIAVDISSRMIGEARKKYMTPLVDFRCIDVLEMQHEQFDLIIVYSAFPHFAEPETTISHLAGMLYPNGRLMICHSEGRSTINAHHNKQAGRISFGLPTARWVSARMKKFCIIDHVEDNENYYLVSGIRKERVREKTIQSVSI